MLLYIPNENHKNLVFFDTEFNDRKLVQVSMIIYESIEVKGIKTYLLKGSVNLYIKTAVNQFFTKYTGITQSYLDQNGIDEDLAREMLENFLKGLNNEGTLLIAHGIKQDADLLLNFGVHICKMDRYCTYSNAKSLLDRDKNLRLIDVCNESGYFAEQHDAYSDAKNVVHAYSYLKLVEAMSE